MLIISALDEDGWGEGVVRYKWSDTGEELLVQMTESVRIYSLKGELTEKCVIPIDLDEVKGIGCTAGAWWLVTTQGDAVAYRHGLEGRDLLLDGAGAKQISLPTVSPDGRTIACVVGKSALGFWSTVDGVRRFGVSVETRGGADDLFGKIIVESVSWSPDSRYLAIRPGFPMVDLMIVDMTEQQMLDETG